MRNLLHFNHLEEFQQWLTEEQIPWRLSTADFQVMQVQLHLRVSGKVQPGKPARAPQWVAIYNRIGAKEHYSSDSRLDGVIARFIRDRKAKMNVQAASV